VKSETQTGTVTNSKGEEVTVTITHPGVGMTQKELDIMRDHVRAGDEPWTTAFNELASNAKASRNPRIFWQQQDEFIYVPNIWTSSYWADYVPMRANWDSATAVQQAIMWYITGDEVYRSNCMNIIRLWYQLENLDPQKGFRWGIPAYQFAFAAEIMRYSEGTTEETKWTDYDTERFTFYLEETNSNYDLTYCFMNQHGFCTMGVLGNAVFRNDFDKYATAVERTTVNSEFVSGHNGSIQSQCRLMTTNEETGEAVPEEDYRVQLIEMGRDQGHAYATLSVLCTLSQSIYVQGTKVDPVTGEISNAENAVNTYNFLDDRLLAGANYLYRYNMGYEDGWTPANAGSYGVFYQPNCEGNRGRLQEVGGVLYNYYKYVEHQDMSEEKFAALKRQYESTMPEGTSNDYPLLATLLYTPSNAKDDVYDTKIYDETDTRKEFENYSACLSGEAKVKTEGSTTYVSMTPGTEIATNRFAINDISQFLSS